MKARASYEYFGETGESEFSTRYSATFFCVILRYSPAIFSDMREICESFIPVRILAGGSCEMRESSAESVRVGNYAIFTCNFL